MNLIKNSDPQYFTRTSDKLYDRHSYKVLTNQGKHIIFDSWEEVNEFWENNEPFLSHVEVLNKSKSKGFK